MRTRQGVVASGAAPPLRHRAGGTGRQVAHLAHRDDALDTAVRQHGLVAVRGVVYSTTAPSPSTHKPQKLRFRRLWQEKKNHPMHTSRKNKASLYLANFLSQVFKRQYHVSGIVGTRETCVNGGHCAIKFRQFSLTEDVIGGFSLHAALGVQVLRAHYWHNSLPRLPLCCVRGYIHKLFSTV